MLQDVVAPPRNFQTQAGFLKVTAHERSFRTLLTKDCRQGPAGHEYHPDWSLGGTLMHKTTR